LEKDRTRRYDTASALEMDVLRYLCDEPVSASPPSMHYRLGKFMRRNRRLVISAALIVVALLAGLAGTGIFAVREYRARVAADQALAAADADRQKAIIARTNLMVAI